MNRILRSISEILQENNNNARRIFHGRGHTYPGLEFVTIDYLAPYILVILYKEPPHFWLKEFVDGISTLVESKAGVKGVLVQKRYIHKAPTMTVWGDVPEYHQIKEGDLSFGVMLGHTQNTGFF